MKMRNYTAADQLLIGVNTRNLRTLEVDSERLQRLAPALPAATCVAESGLRTPDDAERVATWGYRMALVGTALMKGDDPTALLAAMRAAGTRGLATSSRLQRRSRPALTRLALYLQSRYGR